MTASQFVFQDAIDDGSGFEGRSLVHDQMGIRCDVIQGKREAGSGLEEVLHFAAGPLVFYDNWR